MSTTAPLKEMTQTGLTAHLPMVVLPIELQLWSADTLSVR
jgi:hypothetical protein